MMFEEITSAFMQVLVALLTSAIVWGILKISRRKVGYEVSFLRFIGLHSKGFRWNKQFTYIFLGVLTLGVASTVFQYLFVTGFIEFSKSDSSPYWKILKNGFHFDAVVLAFIYCAIKAGLSEEILFRGIIAKRLIAGLGFKWGNICQAFIFWILHFLLVGFVTNSWTSLLQIVVAVTIFPIGLIFGYVNEKLGGGSILSSWILHGSMNFVTFFVLASLLA